MNAIGRAVEITGDGNLEDLVAAAERGAEVTLTRGGKIVARLTRAGPDIADDQARAAIDGIMEVGARLTLGPDLTIRDLIDHGRKY